VLAGTGMRMAAGLIAVALLTTGWTSPDAVAAATVGWPASIAVGDPTAATAEAAMITAVIAE
jgi:hypothetical protein